MADVTIKARCYPTEDRDRVVRAIRYIFPDAEVQGEDPIIAHSNSLENFIELLRRQRIRDAARAVIRRSLSKGGSGTFTLNKQVASIGKISFSEETHALGDIEVGMPRAELEGLVESLSPALRKGANS